jgi:hypothetical protein
MTTQALCSALTAGGEVEAEAVVHEDPAVLCLRRARALPFVMGMA